MKRFALSACVLLGMLAGRAFAGTEIPDKAIDWPPPVPCSTYVFLEGRDVCALLETLNEPPYPLTRVGQTKLAFRLIWSVGERAPSIVIRTEIFDKNSAIIKAYEVAPSGVLVEGLSRLKADEISTIVDAATTSDFWSQETRDLEPASVQGATTENAKHDEVVIVCMSGLTIAGMNAQTDHVVSRECPHEKGNAKLLAFGQAMLRIARQHFPDLATDKPWSDELD